MKNAGFADLNFAMYFEPEAGINTPGEFTDALLLWAKNEEKDLTILEESMEPEIRLDGVTYICRLADPNLASQNNAIFKLMNQRGFTHSVGPYLGYKWVYLYKK